MKLLPLLVMVLALVSCNSLKLAKPVPSCVEDKIEAALNEPVQNPPLEVWEWKDGETAYYYFTAPCCDNFTTLYDESCSKVCSPDGGFTGKGDGKCPQFQGEVQKTLIWKDERERSGPPAKTTVPSNRTTVPRQQMATE